MVVHLLLHLNLLGISGKVASDIGIGYVFVERND